MPDTAAGVLPLAERCTVLSTVLRTCTITDRAGSGLDLEMGLSELVTLLFHARTRRASLYVVGNGGSAAVASHAVTDFVNVARLRALTVHDSSLLTCMANDYGYENAFARVIDTVADGEDVLITISSSGRSQNILNAAAQMQQLGGRVITLSGFAADNPLRAAGDFNIWLDSHDYGMVEIAHQFVLHNLSDRMRLSAPPVNV